MSGTPPLSEQALRCYLSEYEECMESYRHTYQTIWQAGALFTAISAAVIALATRAIGAQEFVVAPWIQVLAPLPILFWYLGIFRPMNRYGELRNDRLAAIEEVLSWSVAGLDMRHFRAYGHARKGEIRLRRLLKLKWVWQPRVSEIVNLLGLSVLGLEVFLIWKNYLI